MNEVNVVVFDVASDFKNIGPFLPHDPSTYGRRQMQQKVLTDGMNRLDSIQPGLHDPVKEKDAIIQDDLVFQNPTVRHEKSATSFNTCVLLQFLDSFVVDARPSILPGTVGSI